MRRLYPLLALFALAACAHDNAPGPVAQPAPKAPDPRICADIEPEPPVAGGIVQPVTQAETDAVMRFLDAEVDARDWGRRGWGRAAVAKAAYCR